MSTPVAAVPECYRTTNGIAQIVTQVDGSGNTLGDSTTRSTYSFLSTAAVQADAIKATPGKIYTMNFFNTGGAAVFFRLYNKATTPAAGDTSLIVFRGTIPAGGERTVSFGDAGLYFSTGTGLRVTASVADDDNTALSANEVTGNATYS